MNNFYITAKVKPKILFYLRLATLINKSNKINCSDEENSGKLMYW